MERENNNTALAVIITLLVVIILGLVGFIVYDKVIKDTNEPNNNVTDNNNTTDQSDNENNEQGRVAYQIGDKVTLTDSSTWHVIKNSADTEDFVSLLSSENINKYYTVTINNAERYLSTTYKTNLIKSLEANDNEIKEVRLLTLKDVSELSGINESQLQPGKSLENGKTPEFLYKSDTMTSSFDEFDCNIMVCSAVPEHYETSPGRMCAATGSDTWPIRPVITISKEYIRR